MPIGHGPGHWGGPRHAPRVMGWETLAFSASRAKTVYHVVMPQPLRHTSARVLEFDALRPMLGGYAWSPLGKTRVERLQPTADRAWIERQQQLTAEVRRFLRSGGHFDFSGLTDPAALVEKSRIEGAALETVQLRDIVLVVDRADEWRHTSQNPPSAMRAPKPGELADARASGENPWPAVTELSAAIADFTEFLRYFRNKILPDGTLDDRASPELARIRRDVEKQKRLIQESLHAYLRRLAEGGAVQDELVTIRGERFVIPVKVEQKKRVQGVVHGASSSGQTVFVEPLETIEQNNELVRLLEEEQEEVHRILLEMTRARRRAVAGPSRPPPTRWANSSCNSPRRVSPRTTTARAVGVSSFQCARFQAAGNRQTGHRGTLVLHNARHPLLERTLRAKNQTRGADLGRARSRPTASS